MANKKISQLTELTSADPAIDVLPLVDSDLNQTKKIKLANLPLSDAEKETLVPLTTDFQNGVIQARNLTTITSSDGYSYTGQPSSIYIGSSVTSIGDYAFGASPMTSIIIPDTVTSIGFRAFGSCAGLTSVTIGNSVTSIGSNAFDGCTALTSINIPDSITSIAEQAFIGCTDLTSITIPNSVTSIGDNAFQSSGLTSIIIPDSVEVIGSSAFYYCPLNSVTIGNSVEIISNGVFASCTSLTSIIIPESVTSIGQSAFQFSNNLTSITSLAFEAPTLGTDVFDGVAATQIIVPVGATASYVAEGGGGGLYGGLNIVEAT